MEISRKFESGMEEVLCPYEGCGGRIVGMVEVLQENGKEAVHLRCDGVMSHSFGWHYLDDLSEGGKLMFHVEHQGRDEQEVAGSER